MLNCLFWQWQFSRRSGSDGGVRAGLGLGAGGIGAGDRGATRRERVRVQRSKVPELYFKNTTLNHVRPVVILMPVLSLHRVLQQVHHRLGTVDAEDQIAALQYVTRVCRKTSSVTFILRFWKKHRIVFYCQWVSSYKTKHLLLLSTLFSAPEVPHMISGGFTGVLSVTPVALASHLWASTSTRIQTFRPVCFRYLTKLPFIDRTRVGVFGEVRLTACELFRSFMFWLNDSVRVAETLSEDYLIWWMINNDE